MKLSPSTAERIEREAEEYCGVKFEGLNPIGQPMYSADNYYALETRHNKMPAYIAGATAEALRAEKLAEALEETLRNYICLADSGDAGFWEPEEEPHVITSREALSAYREASPASGSETQGKDV